MPRRTARKRAIAPEEMRYAPIIVRPRPKKVPPAVRGVKLRTVSIFTMGFAVCCLMAFLAGRTVIPADAATHTPTNIEEPTMFKGLRTAKYDAKNLAEAKACYSTCSALSRTRIARRNSFQGKRNAKG